eukprot:scaffold6435_cov105-Pinguiococcus_pyrenoidosus.AAC.1
MALALRFSFVPPFMQPNADRGFTDRDVSPRQARGYDGYWQEGALAAPGKGVQRSGQPAQAGAAAEGDGHEPHGEEAKGPEDQHVHRLRLPKCSA